MSIRFFITLSCILCFAPSANAQSETQLQETPSVRLPASYWEDDRKPLKAGEVAPMWMLPFAKESRGVKKGAKFDFAKRRATKNTVVVFWAFWCDTWKDVTRFAGEIRGELAKSDTQLIVVAVDASQQPVARPAFAAGKLFFPIVIDADSEETARWGVRRVPTVFVIAKDNTIRATWEGLPHKKEMIAVLKK